MTHLTDDDVKRLAAELDARPRPSETGGTQSLRLRLGRVLHLRVRMRHVAIPVTLLSALGGGYAYQRGADAAAPATVTREWKNGVEKHIADSTAGYRRLDSLESQVGGLKERVDVLTQEVREQRRDAMEQWRWIAQRDGDKARADALERRLRDLEQR